MNDKVYYIDYVGYTEWFHIRVYDGSTLIIETTENGYNEQGYRACLGDFGYKYAGNFDDDTRYKKE